MDSVFTTSIERFRFGTLRIFRDAARNLVSITSAPDFEGYLLRDTQNRKFAQVRFAVAGDLKTQQRLNLIWKNFARMKESDICPKILGFGVFESSPFCLTSLPLGEPVKHFYNRNGALPVETAVLLILEFVRALLRHKPPFYQRFAIHPASVWICRTPGHPRIELGEIVEVEHDQPENHNFRLCVDLLKYLTDDPQELVPYQQLCESLESPEGSLVNLEKTLAAFAEDYPSGNYWMGYNDPASILERITTPFCHAAKEDRSSLLLETAKKGLWPALIGFSMIVTSFMIYCIISLNPPRPQESVAPVPVVYRMPQPPRTVIVDPHPGLAPQPPRVVKVQPVTVTLASQPILSSPFAPMPPVQASPLLKRLLADTGELFEDLIKKPTSEWLVFDDPKKSDQPFQFSDEDARHLAILQLKKASAQARAHQRTFDAIKLEIEILKIAPESVESRVRLHDDLAGIRAKILQLSMGEVEKNILAEAADQNSMAREILLVYHQAQGKS